MCATSTLSLSGLTHSGEHHSLSGMKPSRPPDSHLKPSILHSTTFAKAKCLSPVNQFWTPESGETWVLSRSLVPKLRPLNMLSFRPNCGNTLNASVAFFPWETKTAMLSLKEYKPSSRVTYNLFGFQMILLQFLCHTMPPAEMGPKTTWYIEGNPTFWPQHWQQQGNLSGHQRNCWQDQRFHLYQNIIHILSTDETITDDKYIIYVVSVEYFNSVQVPGTDPHNLHLKVDWSFDLHY